MSLQTFKGRLGGAKKGHSLLKKKRDALKARFAMILKDIVDVKLEAGAALKDGSFALAKANWASTDGDISSMVIERASMPSVTCKQSQENIAGVGMPKFTMVHDAVKDAPNQTLGVGHGGAVINACRQEYQKAVFALVKLASLQTMFVTLDHEIKMTSRRVNALEYVLIPKIVETVHYITQELDEQSREEFFRVKKVVDKKKQKLNAEKMRAAAEELERQLSAIESGDEDSDEDDEEHEARIQKTVSDRLKMPHKRGSIMVTGTASIAAAAMVGKEGGAVASGMTDSKDKDIVFK